MQERLSRSRVGDLPGVIPIEIHSKGPPVALGPCPYEFPDPRGFPSDGLIAAGGDFAPGTIIAAYRKGIFPWPHEVQDLLWFSPDPRAILPAANLHVSRRLARTIRQGRFRVTLDAAFPEVIAGCAVREEGTWITPALKRAYIRLNALGWAHSFEVWGPEGELAGGLYGIAVGGLFGAESMFYRVSDASKVAVVAMVQHCRDVGTSLIDLQVLTPHTASLGAIEIPRDDYLELLAGVLEDPVVFAPA
jgi:leucyl/phenylalanyl-tRNA---protein transferase